MGAHAFNDTPAHCRIYQAIQQPPLPRLFGFQDKWDMPVVRHKAALPPQTFFDGVSHYVVTYHVSGASVRRTDKPDLNTVARTGAVSMQIPGSGGTFESDGGRKVEYAHLYFQPSLMAAVAEEIGGTVPEADFFGLVDVNLQRDVVSYLDRAADKKCTPTVTEMDFRAKTILYGILRAIEFSGADKNAAQGLSDRQVRQIEEAVVSRLCETIRLPELADVVGISPYHFSRLFKAKTGETPVAFVMRIRMENAVRMLKETTLAIGDVAYRTGFSSQSHLSRRLREAYGLTPAQLREQAD